MMRTRPAFDEFEVSELYCPRCKESQPVRRHLLLVLPTGNKYEYRCATCGTAVGAKEDNDASEFASILRGTIPRQELDQGVAHRSPLARRTPGESPQKRPR